MAGRLMILAVAVALMCVSVALHRCNPWASDLAYGLGCLSVGFLVGVATT